MPQTDDGTLKDISLMLERYLNGEDGETAEKELKKLSIHDIVKVLEFAHDRVRIFKLLGPELQAEVSSILPSKLRRLIVVGLTKGEIEAMIHFADADEAVTIINELPHELQRSLEGQVVNNDKEAAIEMMQFLPDTVGEHLNKGFIVAHEDYVVADVARKVETYLRGHEDVPVIIATDRKGKVLGRIFFAHLITAQPDAAIKDLARPAPIIQHHLDQEVLLHEMKRSPKEDLVVVVDEDKRPIGVIHAREVLRVMEEENTQDMLSFAGVHEDEHAVEPIRKAVSYRYRWLILNLATAFLAASVVSIFQETLNALVLLAVYMPIVAGMGGNAGTQTLAVVVRGLALGEIDKGEGKRVLVKEALAGVANGIIMGVIVALVATLWHGNLMLGLVLAVSMVINLFAAGLFGATIPIVLQKLKIDPAISSSIFLTTVTDIVGFFTFLGLATIVLL
ncbi:magnesium transporter [candidate division WWE3 bacterium]|uniref:Magnesium transporter MgtE n=1 Tax=candidate division WWE3 bacterium TaxID=2053526 RepID=A0A955LKA2_UNCKA|nr:magnesium transporter [candidate division WWE3 bacterium]